MIFCHPWVHHSYFALNTPFGPSCSFILIVLVYLFCCWSVFWCYSCPCKFLCRLFLCICLLVILQLKELCILMALQNKLNLQSNWWLRLPVRSAFFLLLCIFMISVIALPSCSLSALFRLLLVHSVYYLVLWFFPVLFENLVSFASLLPYIDYTAALTNVWNILFVGTASTCKEIVLCLLPCFWT